MAKCDICGKTFGYGFSINVNLQGTSDYTNIAKEIFELGQKDVCLDCYYKAKRSIANTLGGKNEGN